MSLELDPVELGFRRPFDREVEEKLRLRNMNSDPVAFKVKTTAPKQYCVRPNSGRIEPGETVEVSVLLQKMTEEPPLDHKCRDKFLVQSVGISASDEIGNVQSVWSNIEQNARSSIQEKKIRVNFLPANGGVTAGAYNASTPSRQSTSAYGSEDQPPAYSSPALNQTPQSSYAAPGVSSVSKYDDSTAGNSRSVGDAVNAQPAKDPTTSSNMATGTLAAAANTVTAAIPTSTEQLKAQLAEAQNQISSLTQQASEGLRQRKSAASSTSTANSSTSSNSGMAMQAPAGVPVPLVAALCLLSFLLAYLLF